MYLAGHSGSLAALLERMEAGKLMAEKVVPATHPNGLVLDGEHTLSDPMLFGEEFVKQATTTSTTTVKQIKEMKKLNVPQEKSFPGY